MQLKLYLAIYYPSDRNEDVLEIAGHTHIRVKRLLAQSGKMTEAFLIADQCADLVKFGEFAGKKDIPIVYTVENPSLPKRWNYVPEEHWDA